jgi:hypothetical protein
MRSIFSTLTRIEDESPLRRFCSPPAVPGAASKKPNFSLDLATVVSAAAGSSKRP